MSRHTSRPSHRARGRIARTGLSIAQTVGPAASVLVSLLAVQLAGVATWGAFVAALILVRLWAQVASFGSRDHLLRAFARDPGAVGAAWQRNTATRAWLLIGGPALFLAAGADVGRTVAMTVWLGALFVIQSHDALVVYRRAFGFGLALELLGTAATVGLVIAVGGQLTASWLIAIHAGVASLRALALVIRFGTLRRGGAPLLPDIGELRAGLPSFALNFSGAIQSRVDLYVVAALLPAAALGEYGVLTNFVLLTQSLAGAIVAPAAAGLYRLRRSGVIRAALRLLALGVPLTLAAAGLTWLVMELLYGIRLAPPTLVAAWAAMLPAFLYTPLVYLCFRDHREGFVVLASVIGGLTALGGTLALAPTAGITGAMAAAAAGQAAVAALHVVRLDPRRQGFRSPA